MSFISQADVRKMLDVIAGLQEPVSLDHFGKHIIDLMDKIFPGSICAFDEIDSKNGSYRITHNSPMTAVDAEKMFLRLQQLYKQNPIYDYVQRGGKEPVVKISDLKPQSHIHRTDFYHDILKPVGIEYQVNVLMPHDGVLSTLTINLPRDFSDEMMEICHLLRRHIVLAHQNARMFTELEQLRAGELEPCDEFGLTPREMELLHWIHEGKRNREIAVILGVATRTVDKHVENILRKLGVESRISAVQAVIRKSSSKARIKHGIVFSAL